MKTIPSAQLSQISAGKPPSIDAKELAQLKADWLAYQNGSIAAFNRYQQHLVEALRD